MNPFEFFIPQNITVGAGTLAKLPECAKKLGGSHAMLISGPTLRKMGVVDKAADYLKDAGMVVDIFTDVEANPSVTTVEKATEAYKESGADFIVALGGGSPMDVAKAAGGTAEELFSRLEDGNIILMPSVKEVSQIWTPGQTFFIDLAKDVFRPENEKKYRHCCYEGRVRGYE